MKRLQQYDFLVIHDYEEATFHLPTHAHTYYEVVYLYKGRGIHILNSSRLPYEPGDLFLISPEDNHHFQIEESTRFVFVKFTEAFFSSRNQYHKNDALVKDPTAIMHNQYLKENKLVFDETSAMILKSLIDNIAAYDIRSNVNTSPIMFYHVLSILALVRETLVKLDVRLSIARPQQQQLLTYVHDNIYFPAAIQIKCIAEHFNISPKYFSAYFKRFAGTGYRDYVNKYRTSLIEKRIAQGQMSLKQIADEFGFIDESHLSHFFKKQLNVTPGEHRQIVAESIAENRTTD